MGNFWLVVFQFQTLIAGLAALLAAIVTAVVLLRGQRLAERHYTDSKVEQRANRRADLDRRHKGALFSLAARLGHIKRLCRQHEGTLRVAHAAQKPVSEETRERLLLPSVGDRDEWIAVMAVLDREHQNLFKRMCENIEFHNFRARTTYSYASNEILGETNRRLHTVCTDAAALERHFFGQQLVGQGDEEDSD